MDDRGAREGERFLIVSNHDRLTTTASLGNVGGGMGPGVEDRLRPTPNTDQDRVVDVSGLTGAQVDPRSSAPNLEDWERSAERIGSGEGVDSLVSHESSSRDHIERLSRWLGVTKPGGLEEGQPGLSSHIPSRDLAPGYRAPTTGVTDLGKFGDAVGVEEDAGLRRRPDFDEGFRGAGLREGGRRYGAPKGPWRLPRSQRRWRLRSGPLSFAQQQ